MADREITRQQWDDKFGYVNRTPLNYDNNLWVTNEKEKTSVMIEGVGKDAEIVTNEKGGKQSKAPMAMHLVDPDFMCAFFNSIIEIPITEVGTVRLIINFMKKEDKRCLISALCNMNYTKYNDKSTALITIAKVLQQGAQKYKPNNWRLIPQEEHINHALIHYLAYLLGDTQDDHLEHCMCRLMMAYATEKSKGFDYTRYVEKEDIEAEEFFERQ